jgi:hypothetical protein
MAAKVGREEPSFFLPHEKMMRDFHQYINGSISLQFRRRKRLL